MNPRSLRADKPSDQSLITVAGFAAELVADFGMESLAGFAMESVAGFRRNVHYAFGVIGRGRAATLLPMLCRTLYPAIVLFDLAAMAPP